MLQLTVGRDGNKRVHRSLPASRNTTIFYHPCESLLAAAGCFSKTRLLETYIASHANVRVRVGMSKISSINGRCQNLTHRGSRGQLTRCNFHPNQPSIAVPRLFNTVSNYLQRMLNNRKWKQK